MFFEKSLLYSVFHSFQTVMKGRSARGTNYLIKKPIPDIQYMQKTRYDKDHPFFLTKTDVDVVRHLSEMQILSTNAITNLLA